MEDCAEADRVKNADLSVHRFHQLVLEDKSYVHDEKGEEEYFEAHERVAVLDVRNNVGIENVEVVELAEIKEYYKYYDNCL